jgi:hypothetical protein
VRAARFLWRYQSGCLRQSSFRLEMNSFDFEAPNAVRHIPPDLIARAAAKHRRS